MEAINFGTQNNGPTHSGDGANHPGAGVGPWVMADLENGVWAGNRADVNPTNTAIHAEFVTALLKGRAQGWVGSASRGLEPLRHAAGRSRHERHAAVEPEQALGRATPNRLRAAQQWKREE